MSARWEVLICEGYDDRDFLGGVLEHLGWQEDRKARNPYGVLVSGNGRHAWKLGERLLEIRPVEGNSGATMDTLATDYLRPERRPSALWFVRDSDHDASSSREDLDKALLGQIERARSSMDTHADPTAVTIDAFGWWVDDLSDIPGVPSKQTLERLVCAAWAEVHPQAGLSIERWLADPPLGPQVTHKHVAMSWFAKYTEGADSESYFFRHHWRQDPNVCAAVTKRLEACGAMRLLRPQT